MDLPFSPTFFHKIDAYQKLRSFESEEDKPIWGVEKAVLRWAASPNHQNLGEYVTSEMIRPFLESEMNEGRITGKSVEYIASTSQIELVLRSLITRGYGDPLPGYFDRVRINEGGRLAGKIVASTKNLRKNGFYRFWIGLWWVLAGLGVLLLILNVIQSIVKLFGVDSGETKGFIIP